MKPPRRGRSRRRAGRSPRARSPPPSRRRSCAARRGGARSGSASAPRSSGYGSLRCSARRLAVAVAEKRAARRVERVGLAAGDHAGVARRAPAARRSAAHARARRAGCGRAVDHVGRRSLARRVAQDEVHRFERGGGLLGEQAASRWRSRAARAARCARRALRTSQIAEADVDRDQHDAERDERAPERNAGKPTSEGGQSAPRPR